MKFQVLSCISHISKVLKRHMWLVANEIVQMQAVP